jgi:hypothetical protein
MSLADFHVEKITIEHAAILTLPTTKVDLLAAPGAGKIIRVSDAYGILDTSAGEYTNVGLEFNSGPALVYRTAIGQTGLSHPSNGNSAFEFAGQSYFTMPPLTFLLSGGSIVGGTNVLSNHENLPVSLTYSNWDEEGQPLGNLTGGNAANTLNIYLTWWVLNV